MQHLNIATQSMTLRVGGGMCVITCFHKKGNNVLVIKMYLPTKKVVRESCLDKKGHTAVINEHREKPIQYLELSALFT